MKNWRKMIEESAYQIENNGKVLDDYKAMEIAQIAHDQGLALFEEIIRDVMKRDGRARDPKIQELLEALIPKKL